jgi:hypothetical protein
MRSRPGAQHQSAECSIASCVVLVRDLVASPNQASEIAGEVSEPRLGSTLDDSVYLG